MPIAWRLPPLPLARLRVPDVLRAGLAAALWLWAGPSPAWDDARLAAAARSSGPQAAAALPALRRLLQEGVRQNDTDRLAAVNPFFNLRLAFREDQEIWGQPDYWASPLEALEKGAGDCEDIAIAKYFALLAMGMPAEKLRLLYVRATQLPGVPAGTPVPHMVLAYYPSPQAEPLILDNLVPEVLPAGRRTDLTPVFSFNSDGLWRGAQGGSAGDPTARLSPWRTVQDKARREGFR